MSGVEIIGLISGIIGILDAAAQVFKAASDASGLPVAFRDAAGRLPLVLDTLRTVNQRLDNGQADEDLYMALQPTAAACKDKASRLQALVERVIPEENTTKVERYALALRTLSMGSRVESLMKGIVIDVQLLADNHVMRLATVAEMERLVEARIEMSACTSPLQDSAGHQTIINYGSGLQNINSGNESQNNNNGAGQQFVGGIFYGLTVTS
ncbi:hypothetical protein BJ166DRAFT_532799 [Pestalotiopsis sp. NC0098]|nr:hypothetical protein BJ166DRAFT_532799 [Pestalotiopsis sp. NC0098]